MKPPQTKFGVLILPFFVTCLLFYAVYTGLHYALIAQHPDGFGIRSEMLDIWIPLGLALVVTLVWVRPRILLLELEAKKGSWEAFVVMMAVVALWGPAAIAQTYMASATGKLTAASDVRDIEQLPPTRYYSLAKEFYVDKSLSGVYKKAVITGKYGEHLDLSLFILTPVFAAPEDTVKGEAVCWIGTEYRRTIDNHQSRPEKRKAESLFFSSSQKIFDSLNLGRFVYLQRLYPSEMLDDYMAAYHNTVWRVYSNGTPIVLEEIRAPFSQRNGQKLLWLILGVLAGWGIWIALCLRLPFLAEAPEPSGKQWWRTLLWPHEGYMVTPVVVDICMVLFFLMAIAGAGFVEMDSHSLVDWGGNYGPWVRQGQWWRLFTCMFLHVGLMHLASNMFVLIYAGFLLEPLLGTKRYALAYLLTGLMGSLTALWWQGPYDVSVGASGAIFGLLGVALVFAQLRLFDPVFGKRLLLAIGFFVLLNLGLGLFHSGVSNAAHLGGLFSGILLGFVLAPSIRREQERDREFEGLLNGDNPSARP